MIAKIIIGILLISAYNLWDYYDKLALKLARTNQELTIAQSKKTKADSGFLLAQQLIEKGDPVETKNVIPVIVNTINSKLSLLGIEAGIEVENNQNSITFNDVPFAQGKVKYVNFIISGNYKNDNDIKNLITTIRESSLSISEFTISNRINFKINANLIGK